LRISQQTLGKKKHGMIIVKCAVVVQKATCCQIEKYRKERRKNTERERDTHTHRPRGREKKKQRAFFDELFGELL
jgi:Zn-finger nucleic acid-binding protein